MKKYLILAKNIIRRIQEKSKQDHKAIQIVSLIVGVVLVPFGWLVIFLHQHKFITDVALIKMIHKMMRV